MPGQSIPDKVPEGLVRQVALARRARRIRIMATMKVLKYPDPRLRLKAAEVEVFDGDTARIADDMLQTMYAEQGIGLAATQVNVQKAILVADVSKDRDQPVRLVNPRLIEREGEEIMEEGCLSVPGIYAAVKRAERIHVKAFTPAGEPLDLKAGGLLAVCIQHEMDHLQGKLFVDYLSPEKRRRVLEKLKQMRAQGKLPKREKIPYALA